MTVSDSIKPASQNAGAPAWLMPDEIGRLPGFARSRPALQKKWPCLQLEQRSEAACNDELANHALTLEGVLEVPPPLKAPGRAFALTSDYAKGQPEAFIYEPVFLILRPDGSIHLSLRPEWAQRVVDLGWATVHPFARYMAGAVPPQSLVIFAPLNDLECASVKDILNASYAYAHGRIGNEILPDTRW